MPSYDECVPDDGKVKSCEESSSLEVRTNEDVVVVEPSFGHSRVHVKEENTDGERRSSISPSHAHPSHSEPLYESSRISNSTNPPPYPHEPTRAVGQKYRRSYSGEVNPPEAHRRINSVGQAAPVSRRSYVQDRQHQRVDSAGLDILTAAVDATQEELADAAGHRPNVRPYPHFDAGNGRSRRSPTEMISYDHGSVPAAGPTHPYRYPPAPPPSYYAPPGYGYPPHYYGPPAFRRTIPGAPPPPPGGYPVQYARGPDPYAAKPSHAPGFPEGMEYAHEAPEQGSVPAYKPRPDHSAPALEAVMIPPAPVPPSHWRSGSTGATPQGVPSYGPPIGTVEANMPPQTNFQPQTSGEHLQTYHHRKTSSLSSWAAPLQLLMGGPSAEFGEHPLKGHHRTTSSSISLLGSLDVAALADSDATFLKNVHSSNAVSAPPFETKPVTPRSSQEISREEEDSPDDGGSKLASGGTSKRVRRKCNVEGCENRVVQGGLCIAHGAKRKHCKYPGCTKNVKKAGLCSTHGPARKRCDTEGCTKVAVQGGKCIAHGAKKKLCIVDGCAKQAILSGMCKKHHDSARKTPNTLGQDDTVEDEEQPPLVCKPVRAGKKPTHTRGLSLFQEMSPEDVGNALGDAAPHPNIPSQYRHRATYSRDYANIYHGGD